MSEGIKFEPNESADALLRQEATNIILRLIQLEDESRDHDEIWSETAEDAITLIGRLLMHIGDK